MFGYLHASSDHDVERSLLVQLDHSLGRLPGFQCRWVVSFMGLNNLYSRKR